jgi:hypothetical protein
LAHREQAEEFFGEREQHSAVAKTGGMTDEDREYLLFHFEMTAQMLAEEVRWLFPTQLE